MKHIIKHSFKGYAKMTNKVEKSIVPLQLLVLQQEGV